MCGVAGILRPGSADLHHHAAAMAQALAHRGPDDHGVWTDPVAGIALAHRRLAVIAPGPDGRQPMVSSCGRQVLAFNGEIYNYRDLADAIRASGGTLVGRSDTEVLLETAVRCGLQTALERSVGMFAGALWDTTTRELLLFRDRMGEKPMYYAILPDGLAFASEPRALAQVAGIDRSYDPQAIASYLRVGYVPAPLSIWRGIRKLNPGTILRWRDGKVTITPWWDLRAVAARGLSQPFGGGIEAATDALADALGEAVNLQQVADVPLGAFLSGGIDSSLMVALMQANRSRPVRTFTIGFDDPQYDESAQARAVAHHLGTDHHELRLSPADAQAIIPDLPRIWDEPFADSSQIPTLLVSRFARQQVTVTISGDGGDELFAGYTRYSECRRRWSRVARWPHSLRRVAACAIRALPRPLWDILGLPLHLSGRDGSGARFHQLADLLASASCAGLYRSFMSQWQELPLRDHAVGPARTALDDGTLAQSGDLIASMRLADQLTYLPDDILVKVDRAAMSVGLETRAPLLDHRVVACAWRIAPHLLHDERHGKLPLRRLLARYLPPTLIDRPKMGFAVPIGDWLRGPLRDWAESLLNPNALDRHGLLDTGMVRAHWRLHCSGRRDRTPAIWNALMLQAWAENQR